jgi:hypothetical protein
MSNVNTREQQLAKLRAARERDLASERAIVSRAVESGVLAAGSSHLFARPGQYPGWHPLIDGLVRDLSASAHSLFNRFVVVDGGLLVQALDGVLARELELLVEAAERSRLICCVCGAARGRQPLSVACMTCDICTATDLLIRQDPEAAAARGWNMTT